MPSLWGALRRGQAGTSPVDTPDRGPWSPGEGAWQDAWPTGLLWREPSPKQGLAEAGWLSGVDSGHVTAAEGVRALLAAGAAGRLAASPVQVVGLDVGGDLGLPLVPVVQQLLLVVQQLLVRLRGELKVGALRVGVQAATSGLSKELLPRPPPPRAHSPPLWHPQGRPPGRSRSRCTWSCRCHSEWSGGCHRLAAQPRW